MALSRNASAGSIMSTMILVVQRSAVLPIISLRLCGGHLARRSTVRRLHVRQSRFERSDPVVDNSAKRPSTVFPVTWLRAAGLAVALRGGDCRKARPCCSSFLFSFQSLSRGNMDIV